MASLASPLPCPGPGGCNWIGGTEWDGTGCHTFTRTSCGGILCDAEIEVCCNTEPESCCGGTIGTTLVGTFTCPSCPDLDGQSVVLSGSVGGPWSYSGVGIVSSMDVSCSAETWTAAATGNCDPGPDPFGVTADTFVSLDCDPFQLVLSGVISGMMGCCDGIEVTVTFTE